MESWRERSIKRKYEQSVDPRRPLRRGIFKGERPKGRKARLDELLEARKRFFYYLDRVEDGKGESAELAKKNIRRVRSCFDRWHEERLEQYRRQYLELLAACERDGLI